MDCQDNNHNLKNDNFPWINKEQRDVNFKTFYDTSSNPPLLLSYSQLAKCLLRIFRLSPSANRNSSFSILSPFIRIPLRILAH